MCYVRLLMEKLRTVSLTARTVYPYRFIAICPFEFPDSESEKFSSGIKVAASTFILLLPISIQLYPLHTDVQHPVIPLAFKAIFTTSQRNRSPLTVNLIRPWLMHCLLHSKPAQLSGPLSSLTPCPIPQAGWLDHLFPILACRF